MSRKNNYKLLDLEKVYQLPLKYDGYNYAWSTNGTMALTFYEMSTEDSTKIIDTINGIKNHKIKGLNVKGCDFYQDDEYIFCVRGWRNLTGTGALNYSEEKATEIQDGFINFIMSILSVQS